MNNVIMRFDANYGIVLECVQEVYELERECLYLGKDFRKTMVLPFMKMLGRYCHDIKLEHLHKILWGAYLESTSKKDFLEKAEIILKPYYRGIQLIEQKQAFD